MNYEPMGSFLSLIAAAATKGYEAGTGRIAQGRENTAALAAARKAQSNADYAEYSYNTLLPQLQKDIGESEKISDDTKRKLTGIVAGAGAALAALLFFKG